MTYFYKRFFFFFPPRKICLKVRALLLRILQRTFHLKKIRIIFLTLRATIWWLKTQFIFDISIFLAMLLTRLKIKLVSCCHWSLDRWNSGLYLIQHSFSLFIFLFFIFTHCLHKLYQHKAYFNVRIIIWTMKDNTSRQAMQQCIKEN